MQIFRYTIHDFTDMEQIKWATFLAMITGSVVDAIIAASLCFTLARLRTGFARMDSMLNSLMLYILNTGVLTSICSITAVSLYAVYPRSFIFLAVQFLLTKLCVNAFLALFNARHHLHAVMNRTVDSSRLGATDQPISMHLRRQGSSEMKGNTEGSKKSGTLIFAHSIADSGDTNSVFRDEGITPYFQP